MIDVTALLGACGHMRYGVFHLPFGDFYYAGDDLSLRLAAYDDTAAAALVKRNVKKGSADSVESAREFLASYMSKRTGKLPVLHLSFFTANEQRIYRELLIIKFGRTISYGELAARAGMPRAGRFVGNAMAKNLFPIFIPCHRVIKGDGRPGNYTSGVEKKLFLLTHEGVLRHRADGL